jgi:hypothetical protein
MLACTHGLGMPKPVIFEVTAEHAHSGKHILARNDGEVGMYNKELLKGGQR